MLTTSTCVKGVRSFHGHVGFYQRFINDFSKTAKPLTFLLPKDTLFIFFNKCLEAFYRIEEALITAPIIQLPNWSLPFEILCDASDCAGFGAMMRQEALCHILCYQDAR